MAVVTIFLTSGTSWTVPPDWNSASNTIEIVAPGGAGAAVAGSKGAGAGGGAYSKKNNLTLTPGASVAYSVGAPGIGAASAVGSASTDAWFNGTGLASASVSAEAGKSANPANVAGLGGKAANGIGDVKFDGGDGFYNAGLASGFGGGGAAGPNGAGVTATTSSGAAGDAGSGGAGGAAGNPPGAGGNGTEWDATHGSGGGGAGPLTTSNSNAGAGGLYGGGGGGARTAGGSPAGGSGGAGFIVIQYTPVQGVISSAGVASSSIVGKELANAAWAAAGSSAVTFAGKKLANAAWAAAGVAAAAFVGAPAGVMAAVGSSTAALAGRKDVTLAAASGVYNWAGLAATLQYIRYTLNAEYGVYTVHGQTLRLFKSSFITVDSEVILVSPENTTALVPEEPREIRLRPGDEPVEDGEEYRVIGPPNRQRLQ